jgi:hypothetical protein
VRAAEEAGRDRHDEGGRPMKKKICVARVPAGHYYKEPRRCEKTARVLVLGADLCQHHEAKSKRGGLELWAPALERRTR